MAIEKVPSIKVKVLFGGLCLFVEWTEPAALAGLYVLMPRWPEHCQMLITPVIAPGGQGMLVPFGGTILDLGNLAAPRGAVGRPGAMADITRFANGATVQAVHFSGPLSGPLASRIRMPLGSKIDSVTRGGLADIIATNNPAVTEHVCGQASVEIDTQLLPNPFNVAGQTLVPDGNGEITFALTNIPRSHLTAGPMNHTKGELLGHMFAYYSLLNPTVVSELLVARDVQVTTQPDPGPQECPGNAQPFPPLRHPWHMEFIDPYNCTVGFGR